MSIASIILIGIGVGCVALIVFTVKEIAMETKRQAEGEGWECTIVSEADWARMCESGTDRWEDTGSRMGGEVILTRPCEKKCEAEA